VVLSCHIKATRKAESQSKSEGQRSETGRRQVKHEARNPRRL